MVVSKLCVTQFKAFRSLYITLCAKVEDIHKTRLKCLLVPYWYVHLPVWVVV